MRKRRAWITCFALAICALLTQGALAQDGSAPLQRDLKTLRQAADAGDSEAQTQLAITYLYGRGIEKDYGEAIKWYRRAAEMTNASAQLQLGLLYLRGEKVEKNYGAALEWLRKAAAVDVQQAQYLLSRMYKDALGVEKDIRESYAYANLAARHGGEAASYRDALEKSMSLSEISAGQERSRQLRKEIEPRASQVSLPPEENQPPVTRPTLADRLAKARRQSPPGSGSYPGEVSFSDTNVVHSEFDKTWLKTIQEHWSSLVNSSSLAPRPGKVVVDFELRPDGGVAGLRIKSTEVGEPFSILCQRAILDPSPYPRLPRDLLEKDRKKSRRLSLTFTYRGPHDRELERAMKDPKR